MNHKLIAIMGAENQEVEGIIALLKNTTKTHLGMRDYYRGYLGNQEVVVTISRTGKVASATTVSALIHEFKIDALIFMGVAGALHAELNVGDVVIGERLVQHDVDVRPFRPQFEIPILGKTFFESDQALVESAKDSVCHILEKEIHDLFEEDVIEEFQLHRPSVMVGDIASGDQFIASQLKRDKLLEALPSLLCVEMEGASVAQICYEYEIPFVVIRTISDSANESASIDFGKFLQVVASQYSVEIIKAMLS